ncbi:hypothetical protein D9619_004170 [Psilocybe cf. subviscida]|uniref:G domain-containing protein n=1 Tax=Psilocybe cf. subviscida TaxID=2480587 RepID=A0A8H5BQL7_9AGAR|nr:hypothetical protein D9619_004170 [Psilocybe cf. subviscida]
MISRMKLREGYKGVKSTNSNCQMKARSRNVALCYFCTNSTFLVPSNTRRREQIFQQPPSVFLLIPFIQTTPKMGDSIVNTRERGSRASSLPRSCTWEEVWKKASPRDVVIFVVGLTGAGKSTFVEGVAPPNTIVPYHGLESDTKSFIPVIISDYKDLSSTNSRKMAGARLIIVDTPGFDDTFMLKQDSQIELGKCLQNIRKHGMALGGIIYLYDISQNRLPSKKFEDHLDPYEGLLPTPYSSIVLGLTGFTGEKDQITRKKHLECEHWKTYMVAEGSHCVMTFPKAPGKEHWKAFDHVIKSFVDTDRRKAYEKKIFSLLHPKQVTRLSGRPNWFKRLFKFL